MTPEQLDALLPDPEDAPDDALAGGGSSDGLRWRGRELSGDATGARFLECVLEDCDLAGVPFDRGRISTSRLADLRAPAWSLVDAALLDVVVDGGRLGALTAHGATLTRVWLAGLKVDYLDLRGATLADVVVTGCTIGELDLGTADLRDVALRDCTVDTLTLSGARCRSVDLRGAGLPRLDGVLALRGATISEQQLAGWSAGFAAELGVSVG